MAEDMHTVAGDRIDNEELVRRLQAGDPSAAGLLYSQNEGFLIGLARRRRNPSLTEDLKQEGAIALLGAAQSFDPERGVKFLTYAAPAVEAAMVDYAARNALAVRLPPGRYRQLRRVSRLCVAGGSDPEATLLPAIQKELAVSERVARSLLLEYQAFFQGIELDAGEFHVSCGGDPAKAYDRHMRRMLLRRLMEEALTARELNIVRRHLGMGQPDGQGMSFEQLAILFNYNGPSGAEKVYKRALKKLREAYPGSGMWWWGMVNRALNRLRISDGPSPLPYPAWWGEI